MERPTTSKERRLDLAFLTVRRQKLMTPRSMWSRALSFIQLKLYWESQLLSLTLKQVLKELDNGESQTLETA